MPDHHEELARRQQDAGAEMDESKSETVYGLQNHGKPWENMRTPWENHGETMENHGKTMRTSWEKHGKTMEHCT